MSTNSNKHSDEQEIDLQNISKSIRKAYHGINSFIFGCIQFVLRNIIIFGILFITGAGLGVYLDRTQKIYDHQILVTPNFGSVDYLYSKVELINAKIIENDSVFLKSIGIKNPSKLLEIKIKPVIDIYRFVNNSEQNYKMLELLAEDNDVKKIVEEQETSKNYPFHVIYLSTKRVIAKDELVEPILKYLNDNQYFTQIQQESLKNIDAKMKANDVIIAQIDNVLNEFSTTSETRVKNPNLVYYNENSQLNDVLKTKNELTDEQGKQRMQLISQNKVIKDISSITNIRNHKSTNGKMKLILPVLFIGFFILIFLFRAFYKNQKRKIEPIN
ncbi:MAG TPA: hypothetical protein VK623_12865 [Flavobacterium sp.]|nr:hypothetical protein [Flavobacterium sp.]